MPNRRDVIEELNFLTELISTRVRTISVGILAFCWLFLLQNISGHEGVSPFSAVALLVPICLAILALVADFAQYCFGFMAVRSALRRIEDSNTDNIVYDYRSPAYVMRTMMFYTKQVLMIGSTVWLLTIVGRKIFESVAL